jgi:hypothetical protein
MDIMRNGVQNDVVLRRRRCRLINLPRLSDKFGREVNKLYHVDGHSQPKKGSIVMSFDLTFRKETSRDTSMAMDGVWGLEEARSTRPKQGA